MDFAVVTPNRQVVVSKPFAAIAADAASRIYPVRNSLGRKDVDRVKREELQQTLGDALREIAREASRG